jgi:hypothetical protein
MDDGSSSITARTACRLLKVAYQQRLKRAGVECLAPRDVAPFVGLERYCDEVDEAIEYLESRRYIADTRTEGNTTTGGMVYRITPEGREWIGR